MAYLNNETALRLLERMLDGDRSAREVLFAGIRTFIGNLRLRQFGPFCRDPDWRAELLVRVCELFLKDDCARLRRFRERENHNFIKYLQVIVYRAAIDIARRAPENVAPRSSPEYHWVVNLPLHEHTRPQRPSAEMFVHLQQVIRHLVSYARPEDIEMLYLAICGLGWHEIEARTGVGHDAARKRVTRLRKSLRARFNRRDGVPRDP